jgi:hypothetical protein
MTEPTVHLGLGIAPTGMTRSILDRAKGADRADALVEVTRTGEIPLMTHQTPRALTPGVEDPDGLLTHPDVTDATIGRRDNRGLIDLQDMTAVGHTPIP